MYSSTLLDHFEHPRNSGELPDANVRVKVENPVCADVLQLALKVEQGRIKEIRFKAKGCVPVVACASMLTELVQGGTAANIAISANDLIEKLGGVPQASTHAAQLAVDAFKMALREAAKFEKAAAQHG